MDKGLQYEIQSYNYLIGNCKNYDVYMWKDVPYKYIFDLKLDNLIDYNSNKQDNSDNYNNTAIDIGCDIMMVNKEDDNDIILVQCKNYLDKNVCIKDLAGFSFLLAFSHIQLKGLIISNTNLSDRIIFKLNHIDKIKYIKLNYEDTIINEINNNQIVPRDYQLEVVNKFVDINIGIIQLPCGMGKTFISTLIAKNFNNIIILSPLRTYATQLYDVFNSQFPEYECNLISMDGERDINVLKTNFKKKNIFSSSFCSTDIVVQLLPLLTNTILIVDEFHNLSLNNLTNKKDNMNKILNHNFDKKIFLSATPKIYNKINDEEYDELEANNFENILGKVEYTYSFSEAIKNKYINDYRFIIPNVEEEKDLNDFIYSNMLYYGYKKCIVYCKNIEECENMKLKLEEINKSKYNFNVYINKINYNVSMGKRKTIINKFKQDKYKLSIILSVHTLDECVDIPECDSVYFTSDVKNPINIIQRICRSMRIYKNKIKSGIFIWCVNYKEIKNIKDTILKYDNELQYKINIKNTKNDEKKNIINKYFSNKKLKINYENNNTENYNNENNNTENNLNNNNNNTQIDNINDKINYTKTIEEFNLFNECKFISIVEFTKWLDINRKTMIANIQNNYKKDTDYFIVPINDEINCIKLYPKETLVFKANQQFIKITPSCFKNICINSNTQKGSHVRRYYTFQN